MGVWINSWRRPELLVQKDVNAAQNAAQQLVLNLMDHALTNYATLTAANIAADFRGVVKVYALG